MSKAETIVVEFQHPRRPETCRAEVGVRLAAHRVIDRLIEAKFIEPLPTAYRYDLILRTEVIEPGTTFGQLAIEHGEVIEVYEAEHGI